MSWIAATLFRMFVVFAFLIFCAGIVEGCRRWLPNGRIKRALLTDVQTRIW